MVKALHKHEIPVGVASVDAVLRQLISEETVGGSAISGRSSCSESGIVDQVHLPISC